MKLLICTCIFFGAAVIRESVFSTTFLRLSPEQPRVEQNTVALAPQHDGAMMSASGALGLVAAIKARPLLSPTRRSSATPDGGLEMQALPRLSAIVVRPEDRVAIFEDRSAHAIVVREGDSFGPWIVRAIERGAVTMAQGGQPVVVPLGYATVSTSPAPVVPAVMEQGAYEPKRQLRAASYLQRRAGGNPGQ